MIITVNILVPLALLIVSFFLGFYEGRNRGRVEGMDLAMSLLEEEEADKLMKKIRKIYMETED